MAKLNCTIGNISGLEFILEMNCRMKLKTEI